MLLITRISEMDISRYQQHIIIIIILILIREKKTNYCLIKSTLFRDWHSPTYHLPIATCTACLIATCEACSLLLAICCFLHAQHAYLLHAKHVPYYLLLSAYTACILPASAVSYLTMSWITTPVALSGMEISMKEAMVVAMSVGDTR